MTFVDLFYDENFQIMTMKTEGSIIKRFWANLSVHNLAV